MKILEQEVAPPRRIHGPYQSKPRNTMSCSSEAERRTHQRSVVSWGQSGGIYFLVLAPGRFVGGQHSEGCFRIRRITQMCPNDQRSRRSETEVSCGNPHLHRRGRVVAIDSVPPWRTTSRWHQRIANIDSVVFGWPFIPSPLGQPGGIRKRNEASKHSGGCRRRNRFTSQP